MHQNLDSEELSQVLVYLSREMEFDLANCESYMNQNYWFLSPAEWGYMNCKSIYSSWVHHHQAEQDEHPSLECYNEHRTFYH